MDPEIALISEIRIQGGGHEQHDENDGSSSYVCDVPGNGIRRTSHQQENKDESRR
jgi:hypothetical protein